MRQGPGNVLRSALGTHLSYHNTRLSGAAPSMTLGWHFRVRVTNQTWWPSQDRMLSHVKKTKEKRQMHM